MGYAVLKHKMGASYQDYALSKPVTTLGRSESNDISINESSISRLHFRLENRNGRYFILDNNSSNGTFLNRRKVTEAPLKDGDTVMAGRVSFVFFQQEVEPDEGDKTRPLSIEEDSQMPPTPKPTVAVKLGEIHPPASPPAAHEAPPPLDAVSQDPALQNQAPQAAQPGGDAQEDPTLRDVGQASAPPPQQPAAKPAPPTRPATAAQSEGALATAPPFLRLVALLLDFGIHMVLTLPGLIFMILGFGKTSSAFMLLATFGAFFHVIFGWLRYGKTLGKHWLGLRIIEVAQPGKVGLGPLTLVMRFLGYVVCAIPFYLLFLAIFFNEEGRGIHDRIAGTRVVKV